MSRPRSGPRDHGSSRLLTVAEVAEILNVSSDYVRRRLVFERRLPYVKVGRHLRIDETDLRVFIDSGRVSAAQYKDLVSREIRNGKSWPISDD